MAADSPQGTRSLRFGRLSLALGAACFAALAWGAATASADTYIAETSTTYLYSLDAQNSPYVLSHDFLVLPGGTLYVGPGAELHIENGSVVRAMGGHVAVEGTAGAHAVVRARPGAMDPAWAGFDVGAGSQLSLRHASLHGATPAVSMQGGSTLTIDGAAIDGCSTWCVRVTAGTNVSIVNATFADGAWGYLDYGSRGATGTNLSFSNFSTAALTLLSGVADASFDSVRVVASEAGLVADGVSNAVFGRIQATVLGGAAFSGAMSVDVRVHNSSLTSIIGGAVDFDEPVRLRVESSNLSGSAFALKVADSSYLVVRANRLTSFSGPCLELPGAVAASLEGNALVACRVAISLSRGSVPPNATAGPSNTVDGKPFLWVDGGAGLVVNASGTAPPGLVALFRVDGAIVSDIELNGSGIYLFGCTDVTLERVHVASADVGVTAVGTSGLRLIAYRAENVGRALDAWNDSAFPFPVGDVLVERARVENATEAFHFTGGSNITLRRVFVDSARAAVRVDGATTVMVANVLVRNVEFGIWVTNSTDVTVVDSAFEAATAVGLLAENSTGVASRNAFLDNNMHASAPGSPSFAFNELLAGNFWTNWSAPDANSDGWADIPYNLSDGTGVDYRPRVVRWDFSPTAMVAAQGGAEVGVAWPLDASPSFDDFGISEVYWEVLAPGDDVTGQGSLFEWTPNTTGPHIVRVSVVGSIGATDEYEFVVVVADSLPPSFSIAPLGRAEVGQNLTVVLVALDNDPAFPALARVEWVLSVGGSPVRAGSANGTTFEVRITQAGLHTLAVTLFDAAGNSQVGSAQVDVGDTTAPEIHIAYEGQPDIGLPFVLDAAATFDASGLDTQSATWTWVEAGTGHEVKTFPVGEVTLEHPGNVTVTLRVCDSLGNCGQAQVHLVVVDTVGPRLVRIHIVAPQRDAVDITPGQAAVASVRAGDEVVFEITAQDASGNVSFEWDFGDGTTAEGARVIHRFARTGEVTVLVTMADPLGNTNPAAVRVRVEPGGFLLGEVIPGVSGDLVVFLLAGGAACAAAFVMMRRRKRRDGLHPDAPETAGQGGR